jgi:hypothetical protein
MPTASERAVQRDQPEEDILLAKLVQEEFSEGYDAKADRHDEWTTFDKYYRLNQWAESADLDWRHYPVTSIITAFVDTETANIAAERPTPLFLGQRDFTEELGQRLTGHWNYLWSVNDVPLKYRTQQRKLAIVGCNVWQTVWNPDLHNGIGDVDILRRDPAEIFPDPSVKKLEDLQEAEYIILGLVRSLYRARQVYGDKALQAALACGEVSETEIYSDNQPLSRTKRLFLKERWFKEKRKLHRVVESGGVILWDSRKQAATAKNGLYAHGEYPFAIGNRVCLPNSIWGMGLVETTISIQDSINRMDAIIEDSAALTAAPQRWAWTDAQIDADKWTNEPGIIISTTMPGPESLGYLQPPSIPMYVREHRMTKVADGQFVSGINEFTRGAMPSVVDTATATMALIERGMAKMSEAREMGMYPLKKVIWQATHLMLEMYRDKRPYREFLDGKWDTKTGDLQDLLTESHVNETGSGEVTRKLDPQYDIEMDLGSSLPTNQAMVRQVADKLFEMGRIPLEIYLEIIKFPYREQIIASIPTAPPPTPDLAAPQGVLAPGGPSVPPNMPPEVLSAIGGGVPAG